MYLSHGSGIEIDAAAVFGIARRPGKSLTQLLDALFHDGQSGAAGRVMDAAEQTRGQEYALQHGESLAIAESKLELAKSRSPTLVH
jgi:hypothetical protein